MVHNVESNVLSPAQDSKNGSFDNGRATDAAMSPRCTTAAEFVRSGKSFTSVSTSTSTSLHHHHQSSLSCATSPVLLPDVRNIVAENQGVTPLSVKTPPAPPPRWTKPGFSQNQSNFTVTTTVTFNVNQTANDANATSQVRD